MNETKRAVRMEFLRPCSGAVLSALCLTGYLAFAACGEDSLLATPAPSPNPAPAPEVKRPNVPTNLHVSTSGADFIEWSWEAVVAAESYDVQFSADESFDAQDDVIPRNANQTFYRRHPLPSGRSAYLRVRSAAGAGERRLTSDWSTGVVGVAATPRTGETHFFTCAQGSPFQWFVEPGDVLALEWTVSFAGFADGAFVQEGTISLRGKQWNEYVVTEKADQTAGTAEDLQRSGQRLQSPSVRRRPGPTKRPVFSSSPDCEATRSAGVGLRSVAWSTTGIRIRRSGLSSMSKASG